MYFAISCAQCRKSGFCWKKLSFARECMFVTRSRRDWAEGSCRPGIWIRRISLEDHRSPSPSPREKDFITIVFMKVHNKLKKGKVLHSMER